MENLSYYERFKTETIYLFEPVSEVAVKSEPGAGYFGKFNGGKEYPLEPTNEIVTRAIDGKIEISKEKYLSN